MRGYTKWSDNDVVVWAWIYISRERNTLQSMEDMLGISHSTFWVCFRGRLKNSDPELYEKVVQKLEANKHRRTRRKDV